MRLCTQYRNRLAHTKIFRRRRRRKERLLPRCSTFVCTRMIECYLCSKDTYELLPVKCIRRIINIHAFIAAVIQHPLLIRETRKTVLFIPCSSF